MTWLILTLLGVISISIMVILTKKFLSIPNSNPKVFGGLMQIIAGIISLPIAFITGFDFDFTLKTLLLLTLVSIIYTISATFYYSGLQKTQVSIATILESSASFWSILWGFLILNEGITPQKFIAAAMIIFAGFLVTEKKQGLKISKYSLFILFAAIAYSFAAIIDNILIDYSNPITYLSLNFLGAGSFMIIVNNPLVVYKEAKVYGTKNLLNISFISILVLTAYLLIFKAYEINGEVSKIYTVFQSQTVLISVLGILVLKERTRLLHKLFAAFLVFIAILLIK